MAGSRSQRADEHARVALDRFATRNEQISVELIRCGRKPIGADKFRKPRECDASQNGGHGYGDHQLDQAKSACRISRAHSKNAMSH
jgi:hypothetical protein